MPYRTELKRPDLKGQFPCSVCGKMFCHSSSLSRHRMQAHFKSYQCMLCDSEIASNETLRSHMFRMHQVSRMFLCRCCNWAFPDKTSLHIHMQSMARSGTAGDVKILAKSATEGGALLQGSISPSMFAGKLADESINCSPGADESADGEAAALGNGAASGSIFPVLNLKEELLDKPAGSPASNQLSPAALGQTTLGAPPPQPMQSTPTAAAGGNGTGANPMAMIAAAAAFHNNVFASLFGMQQQQHNGGSAATPSGTGGNGAEESPRQPSSLVNSWLQNNFAANRGWPQAAHGAEERAVAGGGPPACKLEQPTLDDHAMDADGCEQPIDATTTRAPPPQSQPAVPASNKNGNGGSNVSPPHGANSLHPLVDMLYNKKLATTPGKALEAFLKNKAASLVAANGNSTPTSAAAAVGGTEQPSSSSTGQRQPHTHSPGGQSDSHTSSSGGAAAHNLSGDKAQSSSTVASGGTPVGAAPSAPTAAKCFDCSVLQGKLSLADSRNRFLESKTGGLENKVGRLEGQLAGLDAAGRRYEHEHAALRRHVEQLEAKLIRCQEKALHAMQTEPETIMGSGGLKSLVEDLLQQPEAAGL